MSDVVGLIRFVSPGARREACIYEAASGIALELWERRFRYWTYVGRTPRGRWDGQMLVDVGHYPDTPRNRVHLRTLAIDWCAHGISWCDATTRGGLPKRGAMDLDRLGDIYIDTIDWRDIHPERFEAARDIFDRMADERRAVREVSR